MAFDTNSALLNGLLDYLCVEGAVCGACVPDTAYVSQQDPPTDCCEILSVWVDNVFVDAREQDNANGRCVSRLDKTIGVYVGACWPYVNPQTDDIDEATAAATRLADDAEIFFRLGLYYLRAGGDPDNQLRQCSVTVYGNYRAIRPRGGCIGYEIKYTLKKQAA